MLIFRLFLAIDLAVAAVAIYFFVVGLADGSVSSFNGMLWAALLAAVAAVPAGGVLLNANGYRRAAIGLLAIVGVPGIAAGLLMLVLIVFQPRWN